MVRVWLCKPTIHRGRSGRRAATLNTRKEEQEVVQKGNVKEEKQWRKWRRGR